MERDSWARRLANIIWLVELVRVISDWALTSKATPATSLFRVELPTVSEKMMAGATMVWKDKI